MGNTSLAANRVWFLHTHARAHAHLLFFGPQVSDVVWDDDVQFYEVRDGDSDETLGHFFLDLFPREGKFGHQCVLPIRPSYETADGGYQTPVAALIGNNPKPTPDNPSLLRHNQVVTLFHEFGGLLVPQCPQPACLLCWRVLALLADPWAAPRPCDARNLHKVTLLSLWLGVERRAIPR